MPRIECGLSNQKGPTFEVGPFYPFGEAGSIFEMEPTYQTPRARCAAYL